MKVTQVVMNRLIDVKEAARWLNVTESTLYKWLLLSTVGVLSDCLVPQSLSATLCAVLRPVHPVLFRGHLHADRNTIRSLSVEQNGDSLSRHFVALPFERMRRMHRFRTGNVDRL